jgi:hypothetical protein
MAGEADADIYGSASASFASQRLCGFLSYGRYKSICVEPTPPSAVEPLLLHRVPPAAAAPPVGVTEFECQLCVIAERWVQHGFLLTTWVLPPQSARQLLPVVPLSVARV